MNQSKRNKFVCRQPNDQADPRRTNDLETQPERQPALGRAPGSGNRYETAVHNISKNQISISTKDGEIKLKRDSLKEILPYLNHWIEKGSFLNRENTVWQTIRTS